MPPRLPQIATGRSRLWRSQFYVPSCSICCFAALTDCRPQWRRKPASARFRKQSALAAQSSIDLDQHAFNPTLQTAKLKASLIDLQKRYRGYVNISRLQLALRALEQRPGSETIRIAIISFGDQERTSAKARELVRLFLADPLKEEEEWERELTRDQDAGKPLLLRVGKYMYNTANPVVNNRLVRELTISSPTLNAHRLEILVVGSNGFDSPGARSEDITDKILVPSVEIPTSVTGRHTPITTPVHKGLLLGDGILGAASLIKLGVHVNPDTIAAAIDLPSYVQMKNKELPFHVVDVALAKRALESFRQSLDNAMNYEHEWFSSGVPEMLDWVKAGTGDAENDLMKAPVRSLIQSVLEDANRRIAVDEARQLSALLSSKVSSSALDSLRGDLTSWAQRAHTELRDQLDIAFEGRRWRKLGWWKLFWRVDDVSMIASDILNQRFLTEAEKEIIYLAGKIEEAGVLKAGVRPPNNDWAYQPVSEPSLSTAVGSPPTSLRLSDIMDKPQDDVVMATKQQPWPLHIPVTRSYLSLDTVPALQALAQRLVLQTITTSSLASVFAGLIYISTFTTTVFEAGAVVAFGIVWSLRRMQKKWETARKFWEMEVREEGRKSVRAVEGVVNDVLADPGKMTIDGAEELEQAKQAVEQARSAFEAVTRSTSG